jgi:hypothetical protein
MTIVLSSILPLLALLSGFTCQALFHTVSSSIVFLTLLEPIHAPEHYVEPRSTVGQKDKSKISSNLVRPVDTFYPILVTFHVPPADHVNFSS